MKLVLGNPHWLELKFNAHAFCVAIKHRLCNHKYALGIRKPITDAKPQHRHSAFFELP